MAGTVQQGLTPRRVSGQSSVYLFEGPEGAAVTAKRGAPLIFTAGLLVEAAAQPVAGLVGISSHDGHNAASQRMKFVAALPGMRFEGTLCVDSTNTHVLVATNVGIGYALIKDITNNRWFIDPSDTTHDAVNVLDYVDAIGTTKPRVEFVFMSSTTVFGAAAG